MNLTYFQLSYNHTQDAVIWSWLVILHRYTMPYFREGETLVHTERATKRERHKGKIISQIL